MMKAALKDGVISKEEWGILKEVNKYYGHYDNEFKKAVKDGFISQEECKELRILRNKIYEKAYREAISDGIVTKEERTILKEIQDAADMSDEEIKVIEERVKKGEDIKLREGDCDEGK